MDPKLAHLERSALLAWPAEEVQELDGWRLRFMQGITRRANSVWTAEGRDALPLEQKLDSAEAFYAERGLPSYFHVSPASVPAALDEVLAARCSAFGSCMELTTASDALPRRAEA